MAEILGDQAALVKQNGFGVSARYYHGLLSWLVLIVVPGIAHDDLPVLRLRHGYHYRVLQRRDCTLFSCQVCLWASLVTD